MPELIAIISDEERDYKRFINSLRCPMCGAQLDGNIHLMRSLLECRGSPDEYKCGYYNKQTYPKHETFKIIMNKFEYEAHVSTLDSGELETVISSYDMGWTEYTRPKSKKILYVIPGRAVGLFINKISVEKFEEKLKIYNTFS